jgi:hypothetical protein
MLVAGRCEGLKRGRDSSGLVRHAGQSKAHFYSAEGSGEHEVVEATEMPDAKYFAGKFGETGSERHVEIF